MELSSRKAIIFYRPDLMFIIMWLVFKAEYMDEVAEGENSDWEGRRARPHP